MLFFGVVVKSVEVLVIFLVEFHAVLRELYVNISSCRVSGSVRQ